MHVLVGIANFGRGLSPPCLCFCCPCWPNLVENICPNEENIGNLKFVPFADQIWWKTFVCTRVKLRKSKIWGLVVASPACMCWSKLPYSSVSVDSGPRKAEAWGQSACPTPPRIRRILGGVGHAGRIMGCQIVSNLSMPNTPGNPEDSRGCEACCTPLRQQAMFFLEIWRIGWAWHVIACRADSCLCSCCPSRQI